MVLVFHKCSRHDFFSLPLKHKLLSINGHPVAGIISEGQTIVKLGIHLNSLSVYDSAFQNQSQKVVLLKNKRVTLSGAACYIMHQKKCQIVKKPLNVYME